MMRAPLGDTKYWDKWISFNFANIQNKREELKIPAKNMSYAPNFVFGIARDNWELIFQRYSRGDPIHALASHFGGLLNAWEEAERLGKSVWTEEQQYTRHAWAVNFDHYIVCFWLVGLAIALDIPEDQWQRLLRLVGNEGEDILLDRIIASRSPSRRIGTQLCFKKPYARLLVAIDAAAAQQPQLLHEFVVHWYEELGSISKSGHAKQTVAHLQPYWYKLGNENFEGGAYFGRWCIEAVAAVKAFGLDDRLCLGHEHYPGDLLRPDGPSTHPARPEPKQGLFAKLFGKK